MRVVIILYMMMLCACKRIFRNVPYGYNNRMMQFQQNNGMVQAPYTSSAIPGSQRSAQGEVVLRPLIRLFPRVRFNPIVRVEPQISFQPNQQYITPNIQMQQPYNYAR